MLAGCGEYPRWSAPVVSGTRARQSFQVNQPSTGGSHDCRSAKRVSASHSARGRPLISTSIQDRISRTTHRNVRSIMRRPVSAVSIASVVAIPTLVAAFFWLAPSTAAGSGGSCASNSDCPAGVSCRSGKCATSPGGSCASDSDCGSGKCRSSKCSNSADGDCASDSDCGSAGKCRSGTCSGAAGTCSSDSDCGSGAVCRSGKCSTAAGSSCASNSDCGGGARCRSSKCANAPDGDCASDSDCGTGGSCRSGKCAGS